MLPNSAKINRKSRKFYCGDDRSTFYTIADLSLIMDPSCFFLFIPSLVTLDRRWCAICRRGHRVSSPKIYLGSGQSLRPSFSLSQLSAPVPPNERRNAREYERNISTSDFRAKSSIRPSLLPWRGGNPPTLESIGEYFHNSMIRDFLACLRMSTKLTERENNWDGSIHKKMTFPPESLMD